MKISINGTFYDEQKAVVSVYDHGFLYGLGLFETFRTYEGQPFLLREHLKRLSDGCGELGMIYTLDLERVQRLVTELLQINQLSDAYIRYTLSAGVDVLGLPSGDYQQPTEIIYIKPLPLRDETIYSQGKPLQLLKLPRNTPEGLYRFKSFHYMNNILAKRELQKYEWAAGAEGLMLTDDGFVAEGIVSNLFFVKGAVCHTPSLDTGILPGITRAHVLRIAQANEIPTQDGLYTWEDLLAADEVFLVNSIQEIVPITTLYTPSGQKKIVSKGCAGPITRKLMKLYHVVYQK
ncbi:aminodeoxychorismate lyase [Paenibacillus sp. SYP-B3998]|uniref:Aminodeoxychorismate lyase n=1 Tax=Paenibacillus sp. SYP-B3998 TaxID=2678564 RepID=A0A6G4A4X8_9BACL|nr:aminodeoxychorismate lyase [Paenibacillus sp. SYP-B3998]NEW09566.1 aminodeoxychorismate lyase [Paenibacillus sp. SYP-B3998]